MGCWLGGVAVFAVLNELVEDGLDPGQLIAFACFLAIVMTATVHRSIRAGGR